MFAGCAFDVIRIKQLPAKFEANQTCDSSFTLAGNVLVKPVGGFERTLRVGSRWNCVGSISNGDVYRTRDQVLTVEASNIFEAYIVMSDEMLTGFYLPVERTFVPVKQPIKLSLQ